MRKERSWQVCHRGAWDLGASLPACPQGHRRGLPSSGTRAYLGHHHLESLGPRKVGGMECALHSIQSSSPPHPTPRAPSSPETFGTRAALCTHGVLSLQSAPLDGVATQGQSGPGPPLTCACEHLHLLRLAQLHSHPLQHTGYVITGPTQAIELRVPAHRPLVSDWEPGPGPREVTPGSTKDPSWAWVGMGVWTLRKPKVDSLASPPVWPWPAALSYKGGNNCLVHPP